MTIDLSRMEHWVIAPYAICLFASVVIGLIYVAVRLKHSGMKTEYIMYILFLNFISILVLGNLISAVMSFKMPLKAGFTSLGGATGVLVGALLCSFIFKASSKVIREACVTALPLIYSIAKLGCLFGGCCGGIAFAGPFAVRYVRNQEIVHDYALPVPFVETVVFLALFLAFEKMKNEISVCHMILICSMAKFMLDFLRDVHKDTMISKNQFGCLTIIALTIICCRWNRQRYKATEI